MKNNFLAILIACVAVALASENDAAPVKKQVAGRPPAASAPNRRRQPGQSPRMKQAMQKLFAAQASGDKKATQQANEEIWTIHTEETAHEQQVKSK